MLVPRRRGAWHGRASPLEQSRRLDEFLAGVERRAFRFAEVATGNPDEALDLVQDAMVRFVHRYAAHDAGDWAALFHRVLQNRIRDWYRFTRVRNRWHQWWTGTSHEGEDPLQAVPDPAPDAAARLEQEQFGAALSAALRALPFRQQQAFLLRAWEGLDVAATAAAMGCSEGSVKTHYSRAVQALRARLEGQQP